MTKAEIIEELNSRGDFHSDMANWNKNQLERYLEDSKEAETLSLDELLARITRR